MAVVFFRPDMLNELRRLTYIVIASLGHHEFVIIYIISISGNNIYYIPGTVNDSLG
jgi:hypothetical protein